MEKYSILLSYFDKQLNLINRLYKEIIHIDVSIYSERFVFSLKTQQFYTAIEDLFKQIAKTFENHIEDLASYHKGLLIRLNMEIAKIRPAVISQKSFLFLDKIRAFRHFIRHAYDCELEKEELKKIQNRLIDHFESVEHDLNNFKDYLKKLAS